jgi:stage V sporulation protein G
MANFPPLFELITDIRIFPVQSANSKTLAFVTVELAGALALKNIRVIEGRNGPFVAFPQERGRDEQYYDIFNPITKEARAEFTSAVLEAYQDAGMMGADQEPEPEPPKRQQGKPQGKPQGGKPAQGAGKPQGGRQASGGRR